MRLVLHALLQGGLADLALLSEWHTQHMTPRQAVFQFKNYRGVMG